ncbi:MAG: 3'-5' exonuclease [Prevotellaceae bacterium]|nr:3'-5' exonuclease [Prevotellaceae bacterium]
MKLRLTRPLVFFDLETTGLSVSNDRIVELSYLKVFPDGEEESRTMRFNPGIPISRQASEVTGITDDDVKDKPRFAERAAELAEVFSDCDIAGYNSDKFDVPLLVEEFLRAGVAFDIDKARRIDVQTIYHKKERRTLSAAYRFYCDKELENAHSALADTRATYEVLEAQLERYDDLQPDVAMLAAYSKQTRNVDLAGRMVLDEGGNVVFNFGKYRGRRVLDVLRTDPGYYSWMMQGDFTQNTKQVLTRIRLQSLAARPENKN